MNTAPQLVLAKLHALDPRFKGFERKAVRSSAAKCLDALVKHLIWLQDKHRVKVHKKDYLISVAFQRPRLLATDAERTAYCRVHLSIAISQLTKLIAEMRADRSTVSAQAMTQFTPLLYDYMHDLRPVVEYLERKKNPEYTFFHGTKSYHPQAWQLFRGSRQLALMSVSPSSLDHNVSHIASVFVLRQAMEVKFERIVGVSLENRDLQNPKLRHGFHHDFVKNNLKYFKFTSVQFSLLEQIYKWCSVIVHRAIQPLAWQLPFALETVAGLFDSGAGAAAGSWSIHGGVRVTDRDAMQAAFTEHFCKSYEHGVWCIVSGEVEAVCEHAA